MFGSHHLVSQYTVVFRFNSVSPQLNASYNAFLLPTLLILSEISICPKNISQNSGNSTYLTQKSVFNIKINVQVQAVPKTLWIRTSKAELSFHATFNSSADSKLQSNPIHFQYINIFYRMTWSNSDTSWNLTAKVSANQNTWPVTAMTNRYI